MALTDKLTAIADAIRGKTGGTNPLTLDAMAEAIDGIETGGGGSEGSNGIYMAKITPAADAREFVINHNLGTTDILFCLVWAETLGDYVPTANQSTANVWLKTDIPMRTASGVADRKNFEAFSVYDITYSRVGSVSSKGSATYWGKPTSENTFYVKAGNSNVACFYGSVTYTVVIMAASAFSAS